MNKGESIFHLIAKCDALSLNFPEEREKVLNWIDYVTNQYADSARWQAKEQLRKWHAAKSKELEVVGCG